MTATATTHTPPYILYYFTEENGVPQASITPSTATVGSTTYWVAEAESGSCIGPKKPIVVTVNANPVAPTATVINPTCTLATGTITVTAPTPGAGITYTVVGTNPVVAAITNSTGIFAGLSPGIYNVTIE